MDKKINRFSSSVLQQPVSRRSVFRTMAFTAGGLAVGLSPGCQKAEEKTAALVDPHGLEMPFVFDSVDEGGTGLSGGGEEAQKMADKLSEAWIAFAVTGDPNTPKSGLPLWDPYDTAKSPMMIFDKESRIEFDPLKEQCVIFEKEMKD